MSIKCQETNNIYQFSLFIIKSTIREFIEHPCTTNSWHKFRAAVNDSKGCGAYSLSKSTLDMLLKIYAKELPETHFISLAQGIIKTAMVEHIINEVDDEIFPSAKRLKESHIQTPQVAAENLLHIFPKLLNYESGGFLDVRTIYIHLLKVGTSGSTN